MVVSLAGILFRRGTVVNLGRRVSREKSNVYFVCVLSLFEIRLRVVLTSNVAHFLSSIPLISFAVIVDHKRK